MCFYAYGTRQCMVLKSSFILTSMAYKKKPIQCRSKKIQYALYVKSKQNGHKYTKFSECAVRKVRQGGQ